MYFLLPVFLLLPTVYRVLTHRDQVWRWPPGEEAEPAVHERVLVRHDGAAGGRARRGPAQQRHRGGRAERVGGAARRPVQRRLLRRDDQVVRQRRADRARAAAGARRGRRAVGQGRGRGGRTRGARGQRDQHAQRRRPAQRDEGRHRGLPPHDGHHRVQVPARRAARRGPRGRRVGEPFEYELSEHRPSSFCRSSSAAHFTATDWMLMFAYCSARVGRGTTRSTRTSRPRKTSGSSPTRTARAPA